MYKEESRMKYMPKGHPYDKRALQVTKGTSPRKEKMMNTRLTRNSSMELLRIISMIMIVFHHFACHGGFTWAENEFTIPHYWYNFIVMGGKIGVDIFVLISGYFLMNDNGLLFDFKRILKFWGQVFFYSIVIYFLAGVLGISEISINSLIKRCFPITFRLWWFTSTYFVLYLLHPFLNKLLDSLDKKMYQAFLAMTVFFWSVIPTATKQEFEGNNLLWFITLYAIAAYIRRFEFGKMHSAKYYFSLCAVFSILTYLSSIVFNTTYFYGQNKLPILFVSLTLFMGFVYLKIKNNKWINIIASGTFGVYLIHDDNIIRPFLWTKVFKNFQYQHTNKIILYSIVVVVIVYVVCTIIDLLRQKIFEKPFMWIVMGKGKK